MILRRIATTRNFGSKLFLSTFTQLYSNADGYLEVLQLRERVKQLEAQVASLTNERNVTNTDLDPRQPMKGIRILDFSRILAGPYCAMTLADFGAEVIKVEKPGDGDDTRKWGPPFVKGESTYFLSVNRNKKSITLNLKNPRALNVVKDLVSKSDVFIENFVPGTTKQLGIDYESLKKHNDGLIYASISGFGSSGPYASRRGYDVMLSALGGLMSITGEEGGPPVKVGVALTDVITGLWASSAINSAIIARSQSGKGCFLELSLLDAQISSLVNVASAFLVGNFMGKRWGTAHASIVPYQAFLVKDGYFVVGANNQSQWSNLCDALELKHLENDARFKSNPDRVKNRVELIDILQQKFITKTKKEWEDICFKWDLPYCPVNDLKEVFEDPQVIHNQIVQNIQHDTIGPIKLPGPPVLVNGERPTTKLPPPLLGQHTKEVLRDLLHYNDSQINELYEQGII